MTRNRSGMSMAEVLVALFLMALGSIAILTMFPLGMYHMGQALKDDRTAQSAAQADAFMRMYWRTNVVENPNAGNSAATGYPGYEPLYSAFDSPDSQPVVFAPPTTPIPPGNVPVNRLPSIINQPIPSYPVFVDPMGWNAPWNSLNPSTYDMRYWVGQNSGVYPRRSLNLLLRELPGASHRACSLMDGYGFAENGAASTVGGTVERELRYNWMWILQRPDNTVRNTATMTVVVFDKRSFQYAPQNAEQVHTTINNGMQPLSTGVSIPAAQSVQVQKGGWIMDATYVPAGPAAPFGMRHAIFYRVVSVTDNPTNGTTDLELQTPIRRLDGGTGAYTGTLIFFAGVSEVFERPNLSPNDF